MLNLLCLQDKMLLAYTVIFALCWGIGDEYKDTQAELLEGMQHLSWQLQYTFCAWGFQSIKSV